MFDSVKGLDIARGYYEEYGVPMLKREFADVLPHIAVAFTGSGSEHYGFDDAVSRDHDFEPGFSIFLPGESVIDRRTAFLLERAYAKLPKTYMGVTRGYLSPVGGNRHGVCRLSEYCLRAVGREDGVLSLGEWMRIPDYALAEAVNGEVFFDGDGTFTCLRTYWAEMPEDVRKKRLAGNLLLMAQAGSYNYARCLMHHEPEGAALSLAAYVDAALKARFLIARRYCPYYKWSFRALRDFDVGFAESLGILLVGDNGDAGVAEKKSAVLEDLTAKTVALLRENALCEDVGNDLGKAAYAVNDRLSDASLRNENILTGIR